jgi:hypothetical protein
MMIRGRRPRHRFVEAVAALVAQHGEPPGKISVGALWRSLHQPSDEADSFALAWGLVGGPPTLLDAVGRESRSQPWSSLTLLDVPLPAIRKLMLLAEQFAGKLLVIHWRAVERLAQLLQARAGHFVLRGRINRLVGRSIRTLRRLHPARAWVDPAPSRSELDKRRRQVA